MQKINTVATKRGEEWSFRANIDGSEKWYPGRTFAEVIGTLIIANAENLNIEILSTVEPQP